MLASVKGTDRSTLINTILDDALRGVVVSLRGQLATESGVGEGTTSEADSRCCLGVDAVESRSREEQKSVSTEEEFPLAPPEQQARKRKAAYGYVDKS